MQFNCGSAKKQCYKRLQIWTSWKVTGHWTPKLNEDYRERVVLRHCPWFQFREVARKEKEVTAVGVRMSKFHEEFQGALSELFNLFFLIHMLKTFFIFKAFSFTVCIFCIYIYIYIFP